MISDNLIKNYASARGTSNLVLTVGTIDNGRNGIQSLRS